MRKKKSFKNGASLRGPFRTVDQICRGVARLAERAAQERFEVRLDRSLPQVIEALSRVRFRSLNGDWEAASEQARVWQRKLVSHGLRIPILVPKFKNEVEVVWIGRNMS